MVFGHMYEDKLLHNGPKHRIYVPRADVCLQWNASGAKRILGVLVVFSPFSEVARSTCKKRLTPTFYIK